MEAWNKIAVTCSPGSSKAAAVWTLADVAGVQTVTACSDTIALPKHVAPAAMDFGVTKRSSGYQVQLDGTSGQKWFDGVWRVLTYDALGVLLQFPATAQERLIDADARSRCHMAVFFESLTFRGKTLHDMLPT